jgi:hypothetical protein
VEEKPQSTRDDINVLMDMFERPMKASGHSKRSSSAKRRALQVLDDFVACTGFVQD